MKYEYTFFLVGKINYSNQFSFAVNPFLQQPDKFDAIEEEEDDEAEKSAEPTDPIDSMCQQLSQELTAATVAVAPVASPADSTVNNNSSQQVSDHKKSSGFIESDTKRRGFSHHL